jgi:hypothetical protein
MRWDGNMIVATSFILLCVGSAAFLSVSTLNYLNYYPALGKIQVQVDSVSIVQGSNQSRIDSHVVVTNPTDYWGLRLGNAVVVMFFTVRDSNVTLFGGGVAPRQEELVGGQLGAHSTVSSNIILQLNHQDATSLASFMRSYDGRVIASVTLTVEVITFLVTVTGRLPYIVTQDLPLSPS